MRIASGKFLGTTGIFTAVSILIYIFFFFPKENDCFSDKNELDNRHLKKYEQYPFPEILPLIPEKAKKIQIFYRNNRLKNIKISFQLETEYHERYIASVKELLQQYKMLPRSKEKRIGIIYFQGRRGTTFEQINVEIGDNGIAIETF